jgi:hypothetical protein
MAPRMLLLIGLGVAVLVAILLVLRRDDGKRAALRQAPGLDLLYPHATFLQEELPARSFGGAGSYHLRYYGADQSAAELIAWFDAELAKLGYAAVAPTPDEHLFSDRFDQLIRQYRNGPLTYRLYLLPLPFRLGTQWLKTGYRHVLCTKLSN